MLTHFNEDVINWIINEFRRSGYHHWNHTSQWAYPATLFAILNGRVRDILFSHLPTLQPPNGQNLPEATQTLLTNPVKRDQLALTLFDAISEPIRKITKQDSFISALYLRAELPETTAKLKNILTTRGQLFFQPERAFYYIRLILSCCYLIGYGVEQDLKESLLYLRSAVEHFKPEHNANVILARNLAAALFKSGCDEALDLDAKLCDKTRDNKQPIPVPTQSSSANQLSVIIAKSENLGLGSTELLDRIKALESANAALTAQVGTLTTENTALKEKVAASSTTAKENEKAKKSVSFHRDSPLAPPPLNVAKPKASSIPPPQRKQQPNQTI